MNEALRTDSGGMDRAIRQIGDGWSLLIVWEALHGTTRFDNFQNQLGVARNILANRLAKLVDEGILVKRPIRPGARRLEYRITQKGEALRPALEMMALWGRNASPAGHASGEAHRDAGTLDAGTYVATHH